MIYSFPISLFKKICGNFLLSRHFSVRTKNASFFGLAYDILVHIQAPCLLIFIQFGELHDRFMIILRSHLVYN